MSQHTRHRLATRLATGAAAIAMPALALASALPAQAAGPSFTKIQGAAAHAAGLQGTVDAYRTLLGPDNGSTPGSQPSGHREINWDGVPDTLSAPALMPRNLFNAVVPRGAVFSSTAGNTFQVSADSSNPAGSPVRYGNINAQYPSIFGTFSPEKLFTPLGTTTTRVRFFVPGSNTRAYVKGSAPSSPTSTPRTAPRSSSTTSGALGSGAATSRRAPPPTRACPSSASRAPRRSTRCASRAAMRRSARRTTTGAPRTSS